MLFETLENKNHIEFLDLCESYPKHVVLSARDHRKGSWGNTLLHSAIYGGFNEAARYLIYIGHDLNAIDTSTKKATPLMIAISEDNLVMSIFLVESGALLNLCDINEENFLHYVARWGSVRLLKSVIESSQLSQDQIKELASTPNIRLKFPEDVAVKLLMKETLTYLRQNGEFKRGKNSKTLSNKQIKKTLRSKRSKSLVGYTREEIAKIA